MVKRKAYDISERQRYLERRKRNKVNIRHNRVEGRKDKGNGVWLKTRQRIRRRMLGG